MDLAKKFRHATIVAPTAILSVIEISIHAHD
jgi:hypothetical protein